MDNIKQQEAKKIDNLCSHLKNICCKTLNFFLNGNWDLISNYVKEAVERENIPWMKSLQQKLLVLIKSSLLQKICICIFLKLQRVTIRKIITISEFWNSQRNKDGSTQKPQSIKRKNGRAEEMGEKKP